MTPKFLTPLSPEEQISQGIARPQPMAMADRVRYGELDTLSHVNNKAYMGWFETLRACYFNDLCAPFYPPDQPLPRTVLRNADIRYLEEMVLGDIYVATARVAAFRTRSFTMKQEIWSAGRLRATFSGVVVMIHAESNDHHTLPEGLRQTFETRDGALSET